MQTNYPQKKGIGFILSEAFAYWNRTLVYQILFSLIYFSVFFVVLFYFASRLGIMEQYIGLSEKLKQGMEVYRKGVQVIADNPNFLKFQIIWLLTMAFLFPLNLGLMKMFRKLDQGEKPAMEDLFAGYAGTNFFIYTSFFLFWSIIYVYTVPTIFLALIWVLVTLFCAPLMFFMDKRIPEAIALNFKALRLYPLEILVCTFVAFAFKYFGILTFIGAIFTLPFWNAVIYALYSKIFRELK